MKKIKIALAALAVVAGVGAYANDQMADNRVTQGYVDANCPVTGSIQCGTTGLADDPSGSIFQMTQQGQPKETLNGDLVSHN